MLRESLEGGVLAGRKFSGESTRRSSVCPAASRAGVARPPAPSCESVSAPLMSMALQLLVAVPFGGFQLL